MFWSAARPGQTGTRETGDRDQWPDWLRSAGSSQKKEITRVNNRMAIKLFLFSSPSPFNLFWSKFRARR